MNFVPRDLDALCSLMTVNLSLSKMIGAPNLAIFPPGRVKGEEK